MTDYLRLAQERAPQAAEEQDNPYMTLAQEQQSLQQNRARTVLETALKDDPDLAAERLRVSQTSGVPLRVVERNLDELRVKERARAVDLVSMAQDSPVLYRQITDPTFTTTSVDDLGTLQNLERSVGKGVRYVMGADGKGGLPSDLVGAAKTVGLGATVGIGKMAFDAAAVVNDLIGWQSGAAAARGSAQQQKQQLDEYGFQPGTAAREAVRSGLQSAGTNLALLPLGLARGLYATANQAAATVAGAMAAGVGADAYNTAREQGRNSLQAGVYAIPQAAFEYVFERIPAAKLFGDIAANTGLLKTLGKQTLSEGWTEQVTTLAQDFNEWMNLNPDKTLGQFIQERPEAAYQTFVATLVGVGVQTSTIKGINKIIEKASDQTLKFEQDLLENQMQLAAQSLLRTRSPEQFRAHVQNVVEANDGAKKEIYVDGEVLNQLPQELLAQLPESVREQIPGALESNSTVAIPMADVLTIAPGTELEQILNDNARMRPDAASRVEAELSSQYLQQEAERVLQQAQDQSAWQQSSESVKTAILDQLNTAGRFTPDVNEAYATLQMNFFSTMAARLGVTPQELYDRYSLKVAAKQVGQGGVLNSGSFDQTQTEAFKRFSNDAPLVASDAAETYNFKTGEKVVLEAFHGTKRPDRVGTKFLKKRATSGPMAYHTSSPVLASSYATGKEDTSLSEEDQNFANWFKYKPKGQRSVVDIVRAWNFLDAETKAKIAETAPTLRLNDDLDGVVSEEGNTGGNGSYDYNLSRTRTAYDRRGNPLKAMVEDWLNSGNLFDNEELFMEVLQKAGFPMKDVTYDSPTAQYPFVYKNYIAMQKPLVTSDIPQEVVDALNAAAKTDRSRAKAAGADFWDKNTRTLRDWVAEFNKPDNKYVWTSIPDKVTDVFRSLGYDGIVDWSGKGGGTQFPVYIPFEETQVKSALGNKGKFDTAKNDILNQGPRSALHYGLGNVNGQYQQAGDGTGRATGAGSAPLPGAPVIEGATGPDPRLVAIAEQYARDNGIDLKRQAEYVKVDPERAARIAAAYEAMQHAPQDPAVKEAYENLIRQTVAQYRALEAAGYKFWFIDPENDPYKSPWDAMREMRANQTMGVFPTVAGFGSGATDVDISDNPLMGDTGIQWPYGSPDGELKPVLANDLFRAVHDAFGHGLEGTGFRAQGEENAWQAHIRLFTGSAVAAITSETRGQNSWLNFGPYGESNRTAKVEDTIFADQKTGLMPEWTWSEGRAGDMQTDVLEQGARGTFSPEQLLLTLNENADLSTFLHESGHFFLEVMADLASQPGAPQQIQDDMAATLKWFGIKGNEQVGGSDSGAPLAQSSSLMRWFGTPGPDNNLVNEDGTPMVLYHGTNKAAASALKNGQPFKRSKTGAMGPAVYLGDSAEASAGYDQGVMLRVFARGKYLTNAEWTKYVVEYGWAKAEDAARADGYAGVYDRLFEAAIAVWDPDDIKAVDAKEFIDGGSIYAQDGNLPTDNTQPAGRTPLEVWNAMTLDQKRPYHERWAESFEQYLFEGKAPSAELQPLFRRFRSWLVNVYKSLTQFMRDRNLKLNDEVRQVFDRMIATDEQIAQAEQAAGMLPDFEATNEAIEQLQARSLRDLKWTVKARGKALKALEKEAKTLRDAVEAEVRAEVEQMPEVKAKRALDELQSTRPEDRQALKAWTAQRKAALDAARETIKAELIAANPDAVGLKKGQLLAKNKRDIENRAEAKALEWEQSNPRPALQKVNNDLDIAMIADAYGFGSVDEMLQAVDSFGKVEDAVEGMTDQRMLERHGDLATPEAREAAANEAVHNEARARSLATELKSQAEMLNPRQDTGRTATNGRAITVNAITAAAKQFAENLAARRRLKDLKNATWQHRSAEARAGKAWQAATAKGDTQAAVQAKRDQVLNNATVKALQDAQAEVKKIIEFFKRVTKGSDEKIVERGRDPDVVNAMRAILAAYDIAPRLEKSALAYMETVGRNDPAMYAALKPSVDAAMLNAKPLPEMTVEELRGLTDELRAMWALAKRSRQMEVDGNLMDIEDAADELVNRMGEIGIPAEIPGEKGAITDKQERGIKLQFAKAILTRVEQWSERLDGKFGGPFLRLVFQPIKDAADRYRTAKVDYRKQFTELLQKVAPSLPAGPIGAPEIGYTFGNARDSGAAELLHAILHTGNDSNKRKLLLGRRWATQNADGTLDTSKWDAFITRMHAEGKLNQAHYDFAQGVWDLLEQMKPLAQETHRNVFGRYFAEVTANEFTTPFGTYRGGYVPAQTDSRLVKDAKLRELAEGENESMAYAFPAAPSGFTKSRVEGYDKPLLLDLRALAQHMDKVLLFSHMQGAVTDVRRLLTSKRVSYALDRIDPSAYEGMLIPWLNRAAKQIVETPVVGDRGLARWLGKLRGRAGMALMVANLSNTVQQITGFSSAAVKVKPGLMMRATASFIAAPKAMKTAVAEASPYMKDRMLNEVGAMNDAVEAILIDPTLLEKSQAWTQRHAYFMQAAVDNTLSPIIWTAAYNQATEQGMDAKEAVRFADGVIRQTQGTTLPEDISRFESGPGYARLFTQFVGYFNMMANTNATALKQIADEVGLRKGAGRLLYVAVAGLLAPIWVAEAIAQAFRGGPEDEDKDGWLDDWLAAVFGMGTLRGLVAQVPLAGQLAQLVVNRFNDNPADDKFSLSPAVSLLESAGSSPASVYNAIVEDGNKQKAVRDVAAAATLITGLPFFAAARPVGYLAGMAGGSIEPTGPADLARGLVTGTASPESKQR